MLIMRPGMEEETTPGLLETECPTGTGRYAASWRGRKKGTGSSVVGFLAEALPEVA